LATDPSALPTVAAATTIHGLPVPPTRRATSSTSEAPGSMVAATKVDQNIPA
jgi:hypothetical protein